MVGRGRHQRAPHACGIGHQRPDARIERAHDRRVGPCGIFGEQGERGAAFSEFAHAFPRLVARQAHQFLIARQLAFILQHVLAECGLDARPPHGLGQHEEGEAAFRAIAAPARGRACGIELEGAVAAREGGIIQGAERHQCRDMGFRERAQQREIGDMGMHARGDGLGDVALGRGGLGILVVHLAPVGDEIPLIGGAFVRQDDGVESFHEGGRERDEGHDGGDGHMAVERALRIEREEQRIKAPLHFREGQAARLRTCENGLFGIDREQNHRLAALAQRLDADERILAAADEHGAAADKRRARGLRRRMLGRGVRPHEIDAGGDVHAVAHAEFAQPVHIEPLQKAARRRVGRRALHAQARGQRRLVIAHAGGQMEQLQRRLEGRAQRRAGRRQRLVEDDALGEGVRAQSIAQPRLARGFVDLDAGESERVRLVGHCAPLSLWGGPVRAPRQERRGRSSRS